jgi:hypothetical protein
MLALFGANRQKSRTLTRLYMTKRVVFAGGIQAKALAKAYRLDIALDTDEDVYFIGAESMAREAAQRVIAAADILITDLTPDGPTVPEALISVGTLRIAVPVVTADFLWPFSAKPHPRNMYAAGLPDGPYPAGFGDAFLDYQARDGASEDEAIERYLNLDVAEHAGLDRMLFDALERMRRLDAETGFDLADYVETNFRSQWLFATRDWMNLGLFKHVAARLFGQMGVPLLRVTQLSDTFFPAGSMPIHPAIIAHFGITSPAADYRYPMLDEGYFSFEQYCRRYWRYEFNRLLHAAIAKAESNPSEAIPELRLALETSPDSRAGLRALKDAERAVSDASMLPPLALTQLAPEADIDTSPGVHAAPATEIPPDARTGLATDLTDQSEDDVPATDTEAEAQSPAPDADDHDQERSFIPRTAFGSALVRADQPPPAPLPLDEEASRPLRFTDFPVQREIEPASTALVPLTDFTNFDELDSEPGPIAELAPEEQPPELEPQHYIELPLTPFGKQEAIPAPAASPAPSNRYTPLPPAEHLIPLLPRMLPNTRGMAAGPEKPFTEMPETMPPPPLRPVLPPELHPEPLKISLVSKIMDQLRK